MMQIFGHNFIKNSEFFFIDKTDEIKKTTPNSILFFDFNKEIITYCKTQNLVFGVKVKDIKELVLTSASNASYLLVDKEFAKQAQNIANEYMYDAKIILISNDENDIEFCAKNGIDGIILLQEK
jgi:LPS sulfotransferase NodH